MGGNCHGHFTFCTINYSRKLKKKKLSEKSWFSSNAKTDHKNLFSLGCIVVVTITKDFRPFYDITEEHTWVFATYGSVKAPSLPARLGDSSWHAPLPAGWQEYSQRLKAAAWRRSRLLLSSVFKRATSGDRRPPRAARTNPPGLVPPKSAEVLTVQRSQVPSRCLFLPPVTADT